MHKILYSILIILSSQALFHSSCNTPLPSTGSPAAVKNDSVAGSGAKNDVAIPPERKDDSVAAVTNTGDGNTMIESNAGKTNFTNLYFTDKVFSFADYVKPSKVSIFIVTASWCSPCHALTKKLKEEIDGDAELKRTARVFLLNLPDNPASGEDTTKGPRGYLIFKGMDELTTVLPTTVIFAPTRNQYAKFEGISETDKIIADMKMLAGYCK